MTAVTGKTVNLLTAPIFGLFVFALFVPRARAVHVWIATAASISVASSIAFSGPLVLFLHERFGIDPASLNSKIQENVDTVTGQQWVTCDDPISFQWIAPAALLTSVVVGLIAIAVLPSKTHEALP